MMEAILDYGKGKGFRPQTLERWLGLAEPAPAALLELARELKMGENHLRDIVDWMEEISLRDEVEPAAILKKDSISRVLSDPRLGRADKLKRVKEELRRLRFPRLARLEEEIHRRVRELRLGPGIEVRVPPGLEGGSLTVQMKAGSHRELKSLLEVLGKSLEAESWKEIFDCLNGERV